MLSTSNLKSAQAGSYFEKDDYYAQEEGPNRSRWIGKGAEQLELSGGVEQETFKQILGGQSPAGQPLFSRRIDPQTRRAATDFTFSAPKSVSVAGLVQGDRRVIRAHHLAVDRALQVLEERYAETRVTTETGRRTVKTGNLIAAVFPHGTSREAEPQLHSHCVVMNATQLENGSWYSFSNDSAIIHKKLLGQIYQNELAVELKKIGYEVEQREHGQFDIKGYSPELLATFSTRRGQIEALMAEWKASGKTVRDAEGYPIRSELLLREVANLQTRKVKPQIVEAGQLLQSWQAVIAIKGLSLPELPVEQAVAGEREPLPVTRELVTASILAASILADSIAHCGERDAIFKTTALEKFIFEHDIGGRSVVELEQAIATHPELLKVDEGQGKVTTQTALQLELTTLRLMQQGQASVSEVAAAETVAASCEGTSLSDEQRRAIAISCASLDQFIGWQGAAGAGKTYALNTFREIAEGHGYAVSGYAPSAAAAHELGTSLRIETNTVARLLLSDSAAAAPDKKPKLWLIDEAGLLSMKDAQALLARATAEQARVIFVGDTRQLSAVEAGNPFKSLQAGGMLTAHLDQARRQQSYELRQAVQMISQGEVRAGIGVLKKAGCIDEIQDDALRTQRLVSDFLNLPAGDRQNTLLLSGTHANRLALTAQIRQGMQVEGSLGLDTYTMRSLQRKDLTQAQGRYASSYANGNVVVPIRDYRRQALEKNQHYVVRAIDPQSNVLTLETPDQHLIQIDPAACDRKAVYTVLTAEIAAGDRLKWTKNNRIADTRNGQPFVVESITAEGIAQTVDDQGNTRTINLLGYQHIDYAWVATTYSSQGKTASNVMALLDATTDKEAFYVATSRAKHQMRLYTSSVKDLQQLAERTRANENVSDYLPLFELTHHEQTATQQPAPANHAREVTGDADYSSDRGQPVPGDGSRAAAAANIGTGSSAAQYVAEFNGVLAGVEAHLRREELLSQAVQLGEAAQSIDDGAQQLARSAGATARLHEQVERKARRRRTIGARGPKLAANKLERPKLKPKPATQSAASPSLAKSLELQPPTPDTSLAQQLDEFAAILGYQPGDLMYVRSLLPKKISDELALKQQLKFEIDRNGTKQLIPNTRRGYLTVGSWEFTHLRKGKQPFVYQDGLAQLAELNRAGRGIYFVVNPGGEKNVDITAARALFWENDSQTKDEQLTQARTSGLPIGAVVETHKSIHCYSPLTEPIQNLEEWTQLQERLIQRMDSDPAIRNSSRLMRLPGFDHVRVEKTQTGEQLVFTPVTLRHLDREAQAIKGEIADLLPQWDEQRWQQAAKQRPANRLEQAAAPTLAAENPWDIRNFAQHLNGDHHTHNGWLQVQCPHHGSKGDGHSGNSLHINTATGQYKCHGGCDTKEVYTAARELAEARGWQSPKQMKVVTETAVHTKQTSATPTKPVLKEGSRPLTRWERYSADITELPGPQCDLRIARRAFSDGFSKKQVISLLAKNSPKAQKLYRDEGSTPAYSYVSRVVEAAQQQSNQTRIRSQAKGTER